MYSSDFSPPKVFISRLVLAVLVFALSAQKCARAQDAELSGEVNPQQAIEVIAGYLKDSYVFPDSGEAIRAELLKRFKAGKYSGDMTPREFVRLIDSELEEIGHDKHLGLFIDPELNKLLREDKGEEAYPGDDDIEQERRNNYGFKQAATLTGNVGYLDLRIFFEPKFAAPTAVAAMGMLANCDALIIDLRNNGGGWGDMVAFLSSYFFSGDSIIHLTSAYSRPEDKTYQSWTLPYVPGKRLENAPLYVLVSKSTFSAAEEFCYNLKHRGRATLVGETTRGGAHPISYKPVGENFVLMIPEMTSFNPVTGTNWEGVGVEPHIKASAEKALEVAHRLALEELKKRAEPARAKQYQFYVEGLDVTAGPVGLAIETAKSYAGKYGSTEISLEDDALYYCRGGRMKRKLTPMSSVLFSIQDIDNMRLRFVVEKSVVRGFDILYDDGRISEYRRDN